MRYRYEGTQFRRSQTGWHVYGTSNKEFKSAAVPQRGAPLPLQQDHRSKASASFHTLESAPSRGKEESLQARGACTLGAEKYETSD